MKPRKGNATDRGFASKFAFSRAAAIVASLRDLPLWMLLGRVFVLALLAATAWVHASAGQWELVAGDGLVLAVIVALWRRAYL